MILQLTPIFTKNVKEVYGQAGLQWLQSLPMLIEQLAAKWDFDFIQPMPELSYNFVGLVKLSKNAKPAILKLSPESKNIINELRWLTFIEKSVPEIYESDENQCAFLMEFLSPGYPLKNIVKAGDDEKATRVICQMIRDLQSQHQNNQIHFPHLSELPKAFDILHKNYDENLLSKAKSLFYDLTIDRKEDIVLHGDLHHDNILSTQSGWKVIDPHGYIGDPVAEVGAMIRNPYDCFPTSQPMDRIIQRRLKILAEELPFDPQRIKAWTFCISVLSAAWSFEGEGIVPELVKNVAATIDRIKI